MIINIAIALLDCGIVLVATVIIVKHIHDYKDSFDDNK